MVPRVRSLMRFLIKGSVAGGAVYLVYDQELLGSSDKSQAVLQKAEEVVPNAVYQFSHFNPFLAFPAFSFRSPSRDPTKSSRAPK
ncbi:hypothetical protein JEQ12_002515 [Ovis aries]|uniref:MICOS complex subunit MIC13 n=1 Tax=Ovis aries TaxID=9940 RepID=A0A836CXL3_SHEEP|nr:hypothetical protein JEQ12_002515 [Ovis aries]